MSNPVRCWYCNARLSTLGGLHFVEIKGPSGPVRVHKCCQLNAEASIRKVAAQQRDDVMEDE